MDCVQNYMLARSIVGIVLECLGTTGVEQSYPSGFYGLTLI